MKKENKGGRYGNILKNIFIVMGAVLAISIILVFINYLQVEKRGERIVFIEDGNIKIAEIDGSKVEQLTHREFTELQNAKRTFCPTETPGKCITEDISQRFFQNYFGEVVGLSPDGRYLAATSYNNSIKESIESGNKELENKYLTGSYWNPHYQTINIFDLKKKKFIKEIDMEEKTGEYLANIQKIIWSPKNTDLTVFSMSGNYKINIAKESVTKVPDVLSVYQNTFASIPSVRSVYFTNHWGLAFENDTKIYEMYIGHKIESPKEVLTLSNEKILISPQEGSGDRMFFVTYAGDEIKLYEYKPLRFESLKLVSSWNSDRNVSKDSGWYSDVYTWSTNPISPNGRYIRFYDDTSEKYFIYDVESGAEVSNLEPGWESGSLVKWSMDGSKIIYCSDKKLYEYSISDESKKELISFEKECPLSFHINYIN